MTKRGCAVLATNKRISDEPAYVLHRYDWSESSLILEVFTRHHGRLALDDTFFRLWWALPFNPQQPEPGVYAISATSLWETPLRPEEKRVYAWFRAHEPSARVGYSILIYDVP